MTDPTVALVRRWAVDWLNGRHPEVCQEVLAPDYELSIGGFRLGPRETYVPATWEQLARYPGLVVTVHRLVAAGDRVALSFTESGASARLGGREAAWSGVALFRSEVTPQGRQLVRCWAEEDYYGRRRQLDTGACDPVAAPAAAPWDVAPLATDPVAEQTVRAWLATTDPASSAVSCDDAPAGQEVGPVLDVASVEVAELFSAGDQVAFAAVQSGAYTGGLDGLDDLVGRPARVHLTGLVQVRDGAVTGGRVVRDRLGTARALRAAADGSR